MAQGYTAALVARTLLISRSSLYYAKEPRGSRADRAYDEQIVMACEEMRAYGYRRVAWWLRRKEGLTVNRKRILRAMRERGLLVRSRRLRARRKKEWNRAEAIEPNQIWQSDMTKIWASPAVGRAYLVSVIDCCTREVVGWNLSHRCRAENALAAVERAVSARLPEGSREAHVTLTNDNGTQFTSSRFLETLGRLGITHRRTAYHHPEGNSYIERFHRSLIEEEVWTAEYRSLEEARDSITRWIEEYNRDRPHRGVANRTPHEAFLAFAGVQKNEALTVLVRGEDYTNMTSSERAFEFLKTAASRSQPIRVSFTGSFVKVKLEKAAIRKLLPTCIVLGNAEGELTWTFLDADFAFVNDKTVVIRLASGDNCVLYT